MLSEQKEEKSDGEFEKFLDACRLGDLNYLSEITASKPSLFQTFVVKKRYLGFTLACTAGKVKFVRALCHAVDAETKALMIRSERYLQFSKASGRGDLAMMRLFLELLPTDVKYLISADNYRPFQEACKGGAIVSIDFLVNIAPNKINYMISANFFQAHKNACQNGSLDLVKKLHEMVPQKLKLILKSSYYREVRTNAHGSYACLEIALESRHYDLALYLLNQIEHHLLDEFKQEVEMYLQHAGTRFQSPNRMTAFETIPHYFKYALQSVDQRFLNKLTHILPAYFEENKNNLDSFLYQMIMNDGGIYALKNMFDSLYPAFQKKYQDKMKSMEQETICKAFSVFPDRSLLKLNELSRSEVLGLIQFENFLAFREACKANHTELIDSIISIVKDKSRHWLTQSLMGPNFNLLKRMITAENSEAFLSICNHNDIKRFQEFTALLGEDIKKIILLVLIKIADAKHDKKDEMFSVIFHLYPNEIKNYLYDDRVWLMTKMSPYLKEGVKLLYLNDKASFINAITKENTNNWEEVLLCLIEAGDSEIDMRLFISAIEDMKSRVNEKFFELYIFKIILYCRNHFNPEDKTIEKVTIALQGKPKKVLDDDMMISFFTGNRNLATKLKERKTSLEEYQSILLFSRAYIYQEDESALHYLQILQSTLGDFSNEVLAGIIHFYYNNNGKNEFILQIIQENLIQAYQINSQVEPEFEFEEMFKRICASNDIFLLDNILAAFHAMPISNLQTRLLRIFIMYFFQQEQYSLSVLSRVLVEYSAYIAAEHHNHQELLNDFNAEQIAELQLKRETHDRETPNLVFDVDDLSRQKLYFYMIRNLIRLNHPARNDDIRFLLNIPSVRNLAHQAVTLNEENELFRLCLSSSNQEAGEILYHIPAVQELADRNNLYRDEQRGQLDLRRLAASKESSMTALTSGEQRRLQAAREAYASEIEKLGIMRLMGQLKNHLIQLYQAHPASFENENKENLKLPVSWKEFQEMKLTPEERKAANIAYYQNPYHTSLRFLSIPNPWIDPNAKYTRENSAGKFADFTGYQDLIVLLYLAAKDPNIPDLEGYTPESRLLQFIIEIALLGRAHNWDDTRPKKDKNAKVLSDRFGNVIMEEYDNLKPDRPSCYSGMPRRFFQSVHAHPLLMMLTSQILKQEFYDYIRPHFEKYIQENSVQEIKAAWEIYFRSTMHDEDEVKEDKEMMERLPIAIQTLQKTNLTNLMKLAFIAKMDNQYGFEFRTEPAFYNIIESAFLLKERGVVYHSHFEKFFGLANLDNLINKYLALEEKQSFGESTPTLFQHTKSQGLAPADPVRDELKKNM